MRIKVGSRKSDLARIQAYAVGDSLLQQNSDFKIEYDFRESLGDKNQDDPLWKMPTQGVFTQDFYNGLKNGRWDIVVHSWKDLPVEEREGTKIVATLPRADIRDLLICPVEIADSLQERKNFRVLSSSPRRQYNLGIFLKEALPSEDLEIHFLDVRGNVQTRIQKLLAGEGDALILAKAAIDRLFSVEREEFQETQEFIREAIVKCRWMILPISANPTAAAQGALAIEIAANRLDLEEILLQISCHETFQLVEQERREHKNYGGGCHQKIGVNYHRHEKGVVVALQGLTESGVKLNKFQLQAKPTGVTVSKEVVALSPKLYWPNSYRKEQLFEREAIPFADFDSQITLGDDLQPFLLTRKESLPGELKFPSGQLIWTSGRSTWRSLAAQGIWVNGTLDSLGESELPVSIAWIQGGREFRWQKLTHSEAPESAGIRSIATYHLRKKEILDFDLSAYEAFYWMSGTQFAEALRRWPDLRSRIHASGPGNTLQYLRQELGNSAKIEVFLSLAEWLAHHRPETEEE